ncbi:hypothetical protein TL16_g02254 [Triparma laevis f. inornata]|uniref:Uncharacterized protein n=1 Tax=Triparma laevis f. inornata TaxID=1714386 RepID=A0A9W6ZUU9_9STRA|nr:hypothetical protein TL16_g02254 [Triparma laevis f. inornata]
MNGVGNRFDFKVEGEMEVARLMRLGVEIVYSGVAAVFCQRQVHPRLAEYLEGKGVAVFHRLGLGRVGRVGRICGCRVVNDWEELLSGEVEGGGGDHLGKCALNGFEGFFPHKPVGVVQSAVGGGGGGGEIEIDTGPATVVLTGLTERMVKKKKEMCLDAIKMLEGVVRKDGGVGKGLGGAGCWETWVVDLVRREKWEGLGAWEKKGVEVWTDCLLRMVAGRGKIDEVEFEGGVKVETFGGGGGGGYGGRHGASFSANATGLARRVTMTDRNRNVVCVKNIQRDGGEQLKEAEVIESLDIVVASLNAASEAFQIMMNVGGACVIK